MSSRAPLISSGIRSGSGIASATSSWVRSTVIGLRSSCEASAMNCRWRIPEDSSRSRVAFMVAASRAISSRVPGSGTRRCRSRSLISATSARIASTGRRARPVTHQVTAPTSASSSGTPTIRAATVVLSAASASRSEVPA